MTKILILGGRGFLGAKIARACTHIEHAQVDIASRSDSNDTIALDLSKPEHFIKMNGYDIVIDCADALKVDPEPAIRHCLAHGIIWLETTSDPIFIRRLLALESNPDWTGTLILGAGIFTGYSNMLAAHAAHQIDDPDHALTLGIRWTPLSAGGAGMVGLMTHLLNVPTAYVEDHQHKLTTTIDRSDPLPFDNGNHRGIHLAFSESSMLFHSTNAKDIRVYASLIPFVAQLAFLWTPMFLLRLRPVQWLMTIQMTILRRFLLKGFESSLRMVAVAKTQEKTCVSTFYTDDGMAFAADAVAAKVRCLNQSPPKAGIFTVDQSVSWDALEQTLKSHAKSTWKQETTLTP